MKTVWIIKYKNVQIIKFAGPTAQGVLDLGLADGTESANNLPALANCEPRRGPYRLKTNNAEHMNKDQLEFEVYASCANA